MSGGALGQALLVGAGGFLGAVLRHAIASLIHRLTPGIILPLGTLGVNGLGCLAVGFLGGLAESRGLLGPELRLLVVVGLLGGFTTFSTFGNETFLLSRGGDPLRAAANVALHLGVCLPAVWLGHALGGGVSR